MGSQFPVFGWAAAMAIVLALGLSPPPGGDRGTTIVPDGRPSPAWVPPVVDSGGAVASGWSITITNKNDSKDYPTSTTGGAVYTANVSFTVEVPAGQSGNVSIDLYAISCFPFSPCDYFEARLFQTDPVVIPVGSGVHVLRESVHGRSDPVYRDSYTSQSVAAKVYRAEPIPWEARDATDPYRISVRPADPALDVTLRATVERVLETGSLEGQSGGVRGLVVRADEILEGQPGSLRPGTNATVVFANLVEVGSFAVGDRVEIRGDHHPAEDNLLGAIEGPLVMVWKEYHSVVRVASSGTGGAPIGEVVLPLLLGASIVGVAAAVTAYVLRARRRAAAGPSEIGGGSQPGGPPAANETHEAVGFGKRE